MSHSARRFLWPLVLLVLSAPAHAQHEWPCAWGDLPCLLGEGERRLQQQQPEEAYLFFEQAAFIEPENPAVRQGMGRALIRLGAPQAASDLLPTADTRKLTLQRLEMALGYSDNRNQLPDLSQIHLTLPGQATANADLNQPLKPDAGPVYWLNYSLRQADGTHFQLGSNAATNQQYGLLWGRLETPLDDAAHWQLRGEYFKRLDDGWQTLLGLRYRYSPGWGIQGDAELTFREESVVSNYRFAEPRLGAYRDTPVGGLGVSVQRSIPLGQRPPGGAQWRTSLLWGTQGNLDKTRWTTAAMLRYNQDDDTYHPYLANGQARWQQIGLLTLGLEHPLGQGWSLWWRYAWERQRSNIELFTTHRNESLLGLAYGW